MATTSSSGAAAHSRDHEGALSPLGEMIRLVELRRQHQLSESEFRKAKRELQQAS